VCGRQTTRVRDVENSADTHTHVRAVFDIIFFFFVFVSSPHIVPRYFIIRAREGILRIENVALFSSLPGRRSPTPWPCVRVRVTDDGHTPQQREYARARRRLRVITRARRDNEQRNHHVRYVRRRRRAKTKIIAPAN